MLLSDPDRIQTREHPLRLQEVAWTRWRKLRRARQSGRRAGHRGSRNAGAVDGIDGEKIFRIDVETVDIATGGVVYLVVAKEPVAGETIPNYIEVGVFGRRPGDRGMAAVGRFAPDPDIGDWRGWKRVPGRRCPWRSRLSPAPEDDSEQKDARQKRATGNRQTRGGSGSIGRASYRAGDVLTGRLGDLGE